MTCIKKDVDMDTNKIKERKEKLEAEILRLLKEFEAETEIFRVRDIDVYGMGGEVRVKLEVTI